MKRWKLIRAMMTASGHADQKYQFDHIDKNGDIHFTNEKGVFLKAKYNSKVVSLSTDKRRIVKELKPKDDNKYDVILVMGQSNTYFGTGYDPEIDFPVNEIRQLGRFAPYPYEIIIAKEPLDNFTLQPGKIGFSLTFSKLYKEENLLGDRRILIIPCGKGSTGFITGDWNPGQPLYDDSVQRINYVLSNYNCKLKAILWQQGEADTWNTDYQANLDNMIITLRSDIPGSSEIPFLLGGFVPYWINLDDSTGVARKTNTNNIIKDTPNRIANTAYVDPSEPFVIEKENPDVVPIHYDAVCQRLLGERYFEIYKNM